MKTIATITAIFCMFFTQKTYAQKNLSWDSLYSSMKENQAKIDSIQKIINNQEKLLQSCVDKPVCPFQQIPVVSDEQFYQLLVFGKKLKDSKKIEAEERMRLLIQNVNDMQKNFSKE